jgi:hypothetical protein
MFLEGKVTITKMLKQMKQTYSMNHIGYKDFNSIQDPADKTIEERYSFLQEKVADAVSLLQNVFKVSRNEFFFQILDNITKVLMTYVILFSSDFCSLADERMVERTQV